MDLKVRKNEKCIIGMPRCDYYFNSTRSCFIGFGFNESSLEKDVVSSILKENHIESVDAGSFSTPGQYAFCTKICSKIMTSQFCIILANNDIKDGREVPNANVNMEYGLMLGFNKYVIPFQRQEQTLGFNVAALDTIKYTQRNFKELAEREIKKALEATVETKVYKKKIDVLVETYLASIDAYLSGLDDADSKALWDMGVHLGFHLLNHYDGLRMIYFGYFPDERGDTIIWKSRTLSKLLKSRRDSMPHKVEMGIINPQQQKIGEALFDRLEIWLMVPSNEVKSEIAGFLTEEPNPRITKLISMRELYEELDRIVGKIPKDITAFED